MVATKAKTKGTPKSKASATRFYQAKMASRQAEGLKPKGPAKAEKANVEKDIREAYEAEKEMFRRAAERMAQAEMSSNSISPKSPSDISFVSTTQSLNFLP